MIKLGEILDRIYTPAGYKNPQIVWIVEDEYEGGNPSEANDTILATFRSDYNSKCTLNDKVCGAAVNEIFWTPEGIVVAVDFMAGVYDADVQDGNG